MSLAEGGSHCIWCAHGYEAVRLPDARNPKTASGETILNPDWMGRVHLMLRGGFTICDPGAPVIAP